MCQLSCHLINFLFNTNSIISGSFFLLGLRGDPPSDLPPRASLMKNAVRHSSLQSPYSPTSLISHDFGRNQTRMQEMLRTSSGAYSIGPFTFKLKILNLTLHFCRIFSLFSGCSTNLKTGKLEKWKDKHQNRTLETLLLFNYRSKVIAVLPVAIIVSPGARTAPGGRMKQLLGAVVWN